MRRLQSAFVLPAICIVLMLVPWIVFGGTLAQSAPAPQHIPAIRNGQVVATVCDGSAPILEQDTGALSAVRDADGRYIVAAQLRSDGSRAHVMQHVGAGLEELPGSPMLLAVVPAFSPPGAKQGSLALVPSHVPGGKSRLYYTQRTPEDAAANEGPYSIWCLEF